MKKNNVLLRWIKESWIDIIDRIYNGIIGVIEILLFIPLLIIFSLYALIVKIRCDVFHKHVFKRNPYCYYCHISATEKDEIIDPSYQVHCYSWIKMARKFPKMNQKSLNRLNELLELYKDDQKRVRFLTFWKKKLEKKLNISQQSE